MYILQYLCMYVHIDTCIHVCVSTVLCTFLTYQSLSAHPIINFILPVFAVIMCFAVNFVVTIADLS